MRWIVVSLLIFNSSDGFAKSSWSTTCVLEKVVGIGYSEKGHLKYLKKLGAIDQEKFKVIYEMTDYSGNRYLKEPELKKIAAIYDDLTLSEADNSLQMFQVYKEARLSVLTDSEKEWVNQIYGRKHFRPGKFFAQAGSELIVSMPLELLESPIGYIVLGHELEHVIQYVKAAHLPDGYSSSILKRGYEKFRFVQEYGAMRVEAELALAIPLEQRTALLVKANRLNDPLVREVVHQILGHRATTVEEYVAHQWKIGRYSRGDLGLMTANQAWDRYKKEFVLGLGLVVYATRKEIIQFACDQLGAGSLAEIPELKKIFCDKSKAPLTH